MSNFKTAIFYLGLTLVAPWLLKVDSPMHLSTQAGIQKLAYSSDYFLHVRFLV